MHTKETVWYLCHEYVTTGRKIYYKREMLTTDSYRKLDSVYWSRPRPITKRTFEKAQREGYKCDVIKHYHPPGDIILLEGRERSGRAKKRHHRNGAKRGNAFARLLRRGLL